MKELLKKIKEVEEARFLIATKKPEGLELLRTVYHLAFGEYYLENCSPCHEKAYYKLMQLQLNPNNYLIMSNRKYLLKEGHQVQIFGSSEIFTNANLTDDKAIALLKDNINRAASFELIDGVDAKDFDAKKWNPSASKKTDAKSTVPETIKLIDASTTLEELNSIIDGDDRKGIIEAVELKKAALAEDAKGEDEGNVIVLKQAHFDADPTLAEQGLQVGDTVKEVQE